ncbi:MAG: Hpt domain-containing protein [Gammaproteobacteria bacterium]|nr:Hpt domain-containing protein [Gammaproteobacteria bacterium]
MNGLNTAMGELESLDQMVLNQLHEDMGEDVDEVLEAFLESIDELIACLKARSTDESSEAISRWSHSIKSSAASIGMMKLSTTAETLEKSLKQGIAVDVDVLVSQIEQEYNHSRELLFNR